MRELLAEVERALRSRGWSARQASLEAVGTPELIRDMRRGRVPSVERFRALCEALEIEFYVGPQRRMDSVEARRLERALEIADRGFDSIGRRMSNAEKARIVSAIYDLIGVEPELDNATRVMDLIEAISSKPPEAEV